jgi:hypothetical protein
MAARRLVLVLCLLPVARAAAGDPLREILKNGGPGERAYAVRLLAHFGDQRDAAHLLKALEDPAPAVRLAAAEALGQMRPPYAAEALRKAQRDSDADVRRAAGKALLTIQQQTVIPVSKKRPALSLLHHGSDFEKRSSAWKPFVAGKSATVTEKRAHGGRRSFKLEARPDKARADYVKLGPLPDRLTWEAAVYADPAPGRKMRVGFMVRMNGACRLINRFQFDSGEDGRTKIKFRGSLDRGGRKVAECASGQWIVLRADLYFGVGHADLFVNGKRVAQNVPLQPRSFSSKRSGRLELTKWGVWTSESGVVYVDDVWIVGYTTRRRSH